MGLGLSIVTPAGVALETEVDWVVAPGAEGEFGVLSEHETFLAALRPGVVRYSTGTGRVAVSSGFAEVTGEQVTLLVQTAERADRVDRGRAEAARRRAEEALRCGLGPFCRGQLFESAGGADHDGGAVADF